VNQKRREAWAKRRAKGCWHFIWWFGVVSWGVPMFVLMNFVGRTPPDSAVMLGVQAAIWLLAGAGFGACMWAYTERRYGEALSGKRELSSPLD